MVVLLSTYTIDAQTRKGYTFINPQFSSFEFASTDNTTNADFTRFKVAAQFNGGYFIADNFALITGLGFQVDKKNYEKDNYFLASLGFRNYLFSKLFTGLELGYKKEWLKETGESPMETIDDMLLSAEVGYSFFLNRSLALEPSFYWDYNLIEKYNTFGVKLGFGIYY